LPVKGSRWRTGSKTKSEVTLRKYNYDDNSNDDDDDDDDDNNDDDDDDNDDTMTTKRKGNTLQNGLLYYSFYTAPVDFSVEYSRFCIVRYSHSGIFNAVGTSQNQSQRLLMNT